MLRSLTPRPESACCTGTTVEAFAKTVGPWCREVACDTCGRTWRKSADFRGEEWWQPTTTAPPVYIEEQGR